MSNMTALAPASGSQEAAQQWDRRLERMCYQLAEASCGLEAIIQPVKEGLQLSVGLTSDEKLKQAMRQASDEFLAKLDVYNSCVAPLTRASLQNLEYFLDTYMDADFQHFMDMLPIMLEELPRFRQEAAEMGDMYEQFCADLEQLTKNVEVTLGRFGAALERDLKAAEMQRGQAEGGAHAQPRERPGGAVAPRRSHIAVACKLLGVGGILGVPAVAAAASKDEQGAVVVGFSAEETVQAAREVALADQVSQAKKVQGKMAAVSPGSATFQKSMQYVGRTLCKFYTCLLEQATLLDQPGAAAAAAAAASGPTGHALHQARMLFDCMRRHMQGVKIACQVYIKAAGELRVAMGSIQHLCQRKEGVAQEWLREKTEQAAAEAAAAEAAAAAAAAQASAAERKEHGPISSVLKRPGSGKKATAQQQAAAAVEEAAVAASQASVAGTGRAAAVPAAVATPDAVQAALLPGLVEESTEAQGAGEAKGKEGPSDAPTAPEINLIDL